MTNKDTSHRLALEQIERAFSEPKPPTETFHIEDGDDNPDVSFVADKDGVTIHEYLRPEDKGGPTEMSWWTAVKLATWLLNQAEANGAIVSSDREKLLAKHLSDALAFIDADAELTDPDQCVGTVKAMDLRTGKVCEFDTMDARAALGRD